MHTLLGPAITRIEIMVFPCFSSDFEEQLELWATSLLVSCTLRLCHDYNNSNTGVGEGLGCWEKSSPPLLYAICEGQALTEMLILILPFFLKTFKRNSHHLLDYFRDILAGVV